MILPCIEARQAARTAPAGSVYTASMLPPTPPKTAPTAICLAASFQSVILLRIRSDGDVRPTLMRLYG